MLIQCVGRDMSAETQTRLESHRGPEVGKSLTERTHYAHVRYAASEEAGVIWYDPRDGREKLSFGVDTSLDALEIGERVLTGVKIHPLRPASHGEPGEQYFVEQQTAQAERHNEDRDGYDEYETVHTYASTETFESLRAARDWCRENIDGYAEAESRNAVTARTDIQVEG